MEKFTQIPNVIIDEWMKNMNASSFTVLMVICRKTLGWQKESDYVSQSQIMEFTGLSKNSVIRALKELKDKELINAIEKPGITTNYTLNLTSAKSEPVPNMNPTSAKNEPELVPKVNTQKKKETVSKENCGLHKWLIDLFYVSYSLKYNETFIINGKEGKQIKSIIDIATKINKENPKQEIQKKFDILKDSNYLKLVPGILLSQWNTLVKDKKHETKKEDDLDKYCAGYHKKNNSISGNQQ